MDFFKDLYWFSGIFIFIIVAIMGFVLPHTLRIFRLSRMYYRALIISIFLFLVGIGLQFEESYNCLERRNLFFPLGGILFLVGYKLSDNFILKKKNRNMYYLTMWELKDQESNESTALENLIQLTNIIIAFSVPFYFGDLVVKIWHSC